MTGAKLKPLRKSYLGGKSRIGCGPIRLLCAYSWLFGSVTGTKIELLLRAFHELGRVDQANILRIAENRAIGEANPKVVC